ncbi:MAG: hypothetical protein AAGI22_27640 [Planctomycetota bacterium]
MHMPLVVAALVAASLSAPAPIGVQDDGKPAVTRENIDKLVRHARTGSAVIRPQAADRLVSFGGPAAARLLELSGDSNADLAALGTSLVEVLGRFEDERLRAKLWPALDDSEFPWRPAASRSLGAAPLASERERFEAFLDDPIAPVRLAVLEALSKITEPTDERFLRQAVRQLSDDNDYVRRAAAELLDDRGHGRALLWLVEDLRRVDSYFDQATGEAARYAAMYALLDRGIEVEPYDPAAPATGDNGRAIDAIGRTVEARADAMEAKLPEPLRGLVPRELPTIARAGAQVKDAVLGLALKSCRRGDYFLRWTTGDVLVVGYGNPARIQLPEGTTERLAALSGKTLEAAGDRFYWGRPGCDMESFRVPGTKAKGGRPQMLILSKDEQPGSDLRPGALSVLGAAMAASIPAGDDLDAEDPRTRELARRVRDAFASIGGPVEKAAGEGARR